MSVPVKEVELVPAKTEAVLQPGGSELSAMFERFVSDPNASVDKIERLMALWERNEARKSEGQFNIAMSEAQREMRPVTADAFNPQTKSRYASYEALDRALRPIYTAHGFGLSFGTGDSPLELHVRVTCLVTHAAGHSRDYHIDMPADGKGAKGGDVMTRTHATGSAVSYGMRYLLKMIFNVAVGDEDDDGNRAAQRPTVAVPDGFSAWWDDMASVADEGIAALHAAWNKSKPDYKTHVQKAHNPAWIALKKRAQQVKTS